MTGRVHIFRDHGLLASVAADLVAKCLRKAVEERGSASLALSGGASPRALYADLSRPRDPSISWDRVEVFWSDERMTPPDDERSNYRLASTVLLEPAGVPGERIHRVQTDLPHHAAASLYEQEIRRIVRTGPNGLPCFDVLLLGLGADGHVASIFPGTSAERDTVYLVTHSLAPVAPFERITFTFPLINSARTVILAAYGPEKAQALAFAQVRTVPSKPVARVAPLHGELHWFLDDAAASLLTIEGEQ